MPNTNSAKKAQRQNIKRRAQNRSQRSALKTLLKKTRDSAESTATPATETETLMRETTKKLDQAASRRLIHPNKAARLKSRLVKLARKGQAAAAAAPAPSAPST